jgi:alanine dehydrogenase
MLSLMSKGSVIVDVAIDQGGCIETSKPTTHDDCIYEVDGIVHYCVANMPGAVSMTATRALTNATLPYAVEIANNGIENAAKNSAEIAKGVNIYKGKITYKGVADAFELPYHALEDVIQ